MVIEVQIEGLDPLEFPDDTRPEIIQQTVKRLTGQRATSAITGQPIPATTGIPTPAEQAELSQREPQQGAFEDIGVAPLIAGTVGTAVGGFPAGTAGGILIGEGIQQFLEQTEKKGDVDFPLISGKRAPKSFKESISRVAEEELFGLLGEGIPKLISKAVATGTRETAKKILKSGLNIQEEKTAKLLLKENIPFTRFDISPESLLMGRAEKLAEQSLISGRIMRRFNRAKVKAMDAFERKTLAKIGQKSSRTEIGNTTQAAVSDFFKNSEQEAKQLFKESIEFAGTDKIVPTTRFKESALKVKNIESLVKTQKTTTYDTGLLDSQGKKIFKDITREVPSTVQFKKLDNLANDILNLPDNLSLEEARAWQKRVGREVAKLKDLPEGEMKILYGGMAESIEAIPNPQALDSLQRAKDLFKGNLALQEETVLGDLLKLKPEHVYDKVFKFKNVTDIQDLKRIIPKSDWNLYQRKFAEDILQKSGKGLGNITTILERATDDTLNAVFDKNQIHSLKELGKAAKAVRLPNMKAVIDRPLSFNVVNAIQGGFLLNYAIAGTTDDATKGAILLSPVLIAKMITSKGGAKLLAEALKVSAKSKTAPSLIRRITELAGGFGLRTAVSSTEARKTILDRLTPKQNQLRQPQPSGALSTLGGNQNAL